MAGSDMGRIYDRVMSQCDWGHWLLFMSLTPTEKTIKLPCSCLEFTLHHKKLCLVYKHRKNKREGWHC